ncbi:transposase, partial [Escherichia coli]|nr:transposase [Escherichia coli]
MQFLQNIPPYLFFTGKGGVGFAPIFPDICYHLTHY